LSIRELTGIPHTFRAAMAPIYLAKHVQSSFSGPSLFRERGISGFVPGKISELAIVGIPRERELAYDGYFRNIDAFLYATAKKDKVWCHLPGYTADFQISPSIHFKFPPVDFVPSFTVTSDGEDKLVTKLGAGTSKNRVGKTVVYNITRELGREELDKLISAASDNYASGPDSVTPIGLRAGRFLQNVISAFLATHSYAAFPREKKGNEGTSEMRILRFADSKRNDGPTRVWTLATKKQRYEYIREWSALPEEEEEPDADTEEGRKDLEAKDGKYHGVDITNPGEAIYRAKPSPFEFSHNFGPSNNIPNSPGLVFPYFEGCNPPDPIFVKSMISNCFIRLLGETSEDIKSGFVKIRRGVNSLSTTQTGMIIAHMLAGIKLALDAQCRVYMVHDSEYRGFVLLGTGFSIFDGTSMYGPMPYEKLLVDLAAMDPHQAGLQAVGECINELADKGCISHHTAESVDIKEFRSNNKMIQLLGRIVIPKGNDDHDETMKKLNKALKMLDFNEEKYWEIAPQTLIKFLLTFRDQDKPKIEALPVRFIDWNTDYSNLLIRCLMAFGSEAPSVWNTTGTEFILDGETTKEDSTGKGKRKVGDFDPFVNMPKELLVARKPIMVAYKDWLKVIEKNAVKMNLKERAKEYRLMNVKAEDIRKETWVGLQGLVEVGRRLAGEVAVTSREKKQKKTETPANVDSFLADF
jgi:hypothetical protein